MNPTPDNEEKMERLIHRTLRDLPPRRAPNSLERRVLAELDRRAAAKSLMTTSCCFSHIVAAVLTGATRDSYRMLNRRRMGVPGKAG